MIKLYCLNYFSSYDPRIGLRSEDHLPRVSTSRFGVVLRGRIGPSRLALSFSCEEPSSAGLDEHASCSYWICHKGPYTELSFSSPSLSCCFSHRSLSPLGLRIH